MLVPFTFPATHFRLLSPARDTTQSRLFQLLFSKAGSSSKSPCNCQELCNSVIRVSKPAGNKGPWGSEGRVFLTFLLGKLQHKAPSSALAVPSPRLLRMPPRVRPAPLPLREVRGHSAAPSLGRKERHKRISLLHPSSFCSNKCWPEKPCGYFIFWQVLLAWKQRYFNHSSESGDHQVLLWVLIKFHNLLEQQVNPIWLCCSFVSYGNEAEVTVLAGWVCIPWCSPLMCTGTLAYLEQVSQGSAQRENGSPKGFVVPKKHHLRVQKGKVAAWVHQAIQAGNTSSMEKLHQIL